MTYMIRNSDGKVLASGMGYAGIERITQSIANRRRETVYLLAENGADNGEAFKPQFILVSSLWSQVW